MTLFVDEAEHTLAQHLWAQALAVQPRAHAPYSRFLVGAALVDDLGATHAGCNVENAAYPEGLCAEASALAAMVLAGSTQPDLALELRGRHAGRLAGNQIGSPEPYAQWCMGAFHDRCCLSCD